MAALLSRATLGELVKQKTEISFGRCRRVLLASLIALALFGVLGAATSREAQAAGTGYYWTNHNGTNWECWWIYHGTDQYGNAVWTEDGCKFYYGGQYPAHYLVLSTNEIWVDSGGQWVLRSSYWRSSPATTTIGGYSANRAGYDYFSQQVADSTFSRWWGAGSSRSGQLSATRQAPEAPTGSEAVSASSAESSPPMATRTAGASRTTEVAATDFPWRVCQDDDGCFRYGGRAWNKINTSKAQGGSYRVSSSKTLGAFFAAKGATDAGGSTMKLVTATGPNMGKAKVLVVNLAQAKVVKKVTFDLQTQATRYKVEKSIKGLTPHRAYGLVVLSANGRPVAVDAVGYEAHGNMCHNVVR
jgi:hypothetical protein